MGYVRLKAGSYLAISNDNRLLEVHADSPKEAKETAKAVWANHYSAMGPVKTIRVVQIPNMILYVGVPR